MAEAGHIGKPDWPNQLSLHLKTFIHWSSGAICLTESSPVCNSSQILGTHLTVWQPMNTGREKHITTVKQNPIQRTCYYTQGDLGQSYVPPLYGQPVPCILHQSYLQHHIVNQTAFINVMSEPLHNQDK